MRSLVVLGVPLGFFGLCILSIWYVSKQVNVLFGQALGLNSYVPILGVVAVLVIGSLFAIGATAKSSSAIMSTLNVIGGYLFTFHLFLLLSFLLLQLFQIWVPFPKVWNGTIAVSVGLITTIAGAIAADSAAVKVTKIPIPKLTRDISVMQISDVHLGHHRGRAYLENIVEETNRQKPDIVVITGDLVDSNSALVPGVLEPLSKLSAPTFFVGGNHENYIDTPRAFALIAEQGVRVLHNEVVETNGLQLVGLDYMNADDSAIDLHPSSDRRTIQNVLPTLHLKNDLPTVLLHHSPVGTRYVAAAGVDLMLAGHTHAGQLIPGSWIARLIFPFNLGLGVQGRTKVFVSQGAGTFMMRIRLGTSNEINLLKLSPA